MSADPTTTETFSSGRLDDGSIPDLRLVHYNDVYHLDPSSAEPVGGISRFMTVINEYRHNEKYQGQPELITIFSGDAFNPSLESSVTKGDHMVPILNKIGTDVACVGNHDFDFGVRQFAHLSTKCHFPWLIANVLDPALGVDVPIGHAKRTHMVTTPNGIKIGYIGLGEREWLETINSLPPNLIYKSASETAKELVPKLREAGADIVICISHMREPNDHKLAQNTGDLIDIILGGHDHYYAHSLINGVHVLRSGTDFKQLSYIEVRRRTNDVSKWDFDIIRRDMYSSISKDAETCALVDKLTSSFRHSLERPIGWTAAPLDSRFRTVRLRESNIGNFVCDIMRHYHHADCAIMAAGTIRGDQVYPPGALRAKDIITCFPFEDPVVLLRVTGKAIWGALENGVSLYPALEGRFPQVSNIYYEFSASKAPGSRIVQARIGGEPIDFDRAYTLATRGYMGRGKDGFQSLLVQSEGGDAEELVSEENGILISAMLRQYFMGLRTIGQWKNLSDCWKSVAEECFSPVERPSVDHLFNRSSEKRAPPSPAWAEWLERRSGILLAPVNEEDESSGSAESSGASTPMNEFETIDTEMLLMRKFFTKWARLAGVREPDTTDYLQEEEITVDWTRVIAPRVEGRIKMLP